MFQPDYVLQIWWIQPATFYGKVATHKLCTIWIFRKSYLPSDEINNSFISQPRKLQIRVRFNLDLFIFGYRTLLEYRSRFPVIIEVVFLYHYSTQHGARDFCCFSDEQTSAQSAFFGLLQKVFTHVAAAMLIYCNKRV